MEKDKAPKKIAVGRIVMNAIRKLESKNGVSLPEVKKFLREVKNIDTGANDGEIKLSIKNAIDRGFLVKEGGNYKVKETRRRRRTRSKRRSGSRRGRRRTTGSRKTRSRRRRSGGRKRSSRRSRSGRSRRRHRKTAAEDENV